MQKIDNSGGRPFSKERVILKKRYHKNSNMITISALAFLLLLPLSYSVSTAGEALKLKLDYSLTDEQSTKRTMSSSGTMDNKEKILVMLVSSNTIALSVRL